jgi:DNA-directed RNA polymerase specialized sigma24 family protein
MNSATMSTRLTAIVMNSATVYIRRRQSRSMQSFQQTDVENTLDTEDCFVGSRSGPEGVNGHAELLGKLQGASKRLSPNARGAFQLVVLHGVSLREASETVGVSMGTIKARVFHGRRQVLQMLRASVLQQAAGKPRSVSGRPGHGALKVQLEASRAAA